MTDTAMLAMFDLDDTLLDTGLALTKARASLLQKIGLTGGVEELDAWKRLTWFFHSEDLAVIVPILARDSGTKIDVQDWTSLLREYWQMETDVITWKAGATEMLDDLSRLGFNIGIVCNGAVERQQGKLRRVGLWDRLQSGAAIRIADGLTVTAKPRPDALQDLRRTLGAEHGMACYVGDLPLDMVAANLAGLISIKLDSPSLAAGLPPEHGQHPLEIPNHRITNLSELAGLLDRLRAYGRT